MSRIKKKQSQQSQQLSNKSSDVEPVIVTRPKKNLKKLEDIGVDDESDF